MDLTALDLRYIAQEMQGFVGGKIEKIMQEGKDVLFTLYVPGRPKVHLRILLPSMLCVHETKPDAYPKMPPGFAMFLRKYIEGARIVTIAQRGFDRILQFELEHRGEPRSLTVEFLPPGNIILVMDGKIKGLLENQNFKDRTLRGGIAYEAPPLAFDPQVADDATLTNAITTSDKRSIVATLAMEMGLGGVYAEEVCARAGIEKMRGDLNAAEIAVVVTAVRELFSQPIAPHEDGARIYPFAMRSRATTPCASSSLLAALAHFAPQAGASAEAKVEGAVRARGSKLAVMLKAQESSIRKLSEAVAREQRAAERMYEEYVLLNEILTLARTARQEKQDVAKALGKFKCVHGYDPASGDIEVELSDEAA